MTDTNTIAQTETDWFEATTPAEEAPPGVKRFMRQIMDDKVTNPRNGGWGHVMETAHECEPETPEELADAIFGKSYTVGQEGDKQELTGDELAHELACEQAAKLDKAMQWLLEQRDDETGFYPLVMEYLQSKLIDETFIGQRAEKRALEAYCEHKGLEPDAYITQAFEICSRVSPDRKDDGTFDGNRSYESLGVDAIIPDGDGWETVQVKPHDYVMRRKRFDDKWFNMEDVDTLIKYNEHTGEVTKIPVSELDEESIDKSH